MDGWVALWEQKGMYEQPDYESSLQLPYLPGAWHNVAVMFDLDQRAMALTGRETVLDLAAGCGWAARRFAERGCRAFAADIVADEVYGIGRAWGIMEHAGVYFEPLLADGEQLPFAAHSLDVVFICGGLHHFQPFAPVLREVLRVLKPGGSFVATGEPALALAENERAVLDEMEEPKMGIVERRPKVFDYWLALKRAGFVRIQIDSTETYGRDAAGVRAALRNAREKMSATIRPHYRPLAWLGLGLLQLLPASLAQSLLLCAQGGRLLIRGRAPAGG